MLVFDIKRYSINDGPGIRITIFFKGCPLSCVWCHNPEGMSAKQSKLYTAKRCIGCGLCIQACKNGALSAGDPFILNTDSSKCTLCGACAAVCPAKAMEMAGKKFCLEEILSEIKKEEIFFKESGGGVTICGGEPLMHKSQLLELLKACGERGYHRCVDTTLFAEQSLVEEVANNCELFLVDLKMMNTTLHKQFTGVGNELILSNIRYLASIGKEFIIRIPLISGVNASLDNLVASAQFLSQLQNKYPDKFIGRKIKVELLPYHNIAIGKHVRLGSLYNPDSLKMGEPSAQELEVAKRIFIEEGVEIVG